MFSIWPTSLYSKEVIIFKNFRHNFGCPQHFIIVDFHLIPLREVSVYLRIFQTIETYAFFIVCEVMTDITSFIIQTLLVYHLEGLSLLSLVNYAEYL